MLASSTFSDQTSTTRNSPPNAAERAIKRPRSIPGSRAILGALLIAIAGTGCFALTSGVTSDSTQSYVVAAHDLPAGARIKNDDLRLVKSETSKAVSSHTFSNRAQLEGKTLLGPIKSGELIQHGLLTSKVSPETKREISVGLASSRAVGGDLKSGETVSVIVTDQTAKQTTVAVENATVIRIEKQSSGIGANGSDITVVLAIDSDLEATAIANGADQGSITLLRTTGTNN